MIVYGDQCRTLGCRAVLHGVVETLRRAAWEAPGLPRHARLVDALLQAGGLVQGLADAEFERRGCDDDSPVQHGATALLMAVAAGVCRSWRSAFSSQEVAFGAEAQALAAHDLPERITVKLAEGPAFYALYPEAYLEAACALPRWQQNVVIGLRSVGTVLAAMVSSALGNAPVITVRPVGHPFARQVRLSPRLEARLLEYREARFVVADEGPGLSGSSFGAVGDWLEDGGVPRQRIVFLPAHANPPGAQAASRHLSRWRQVARPVPDFEALIAPRLGQWAEAVIGPGVEPPRDLSGGGWRALRPDGAGLPADPPRERRKTMMRTERGTWLLKFAGLGLHGEQALHRAQRLGEAGLTPAPAGLRHGFLVEPWLEAATGIQDLPRPTILRALTRYLRFRARAFPAATAGAAPAALASMAHANIAEVFGECWADSWSRAHGHLPGFGPPIVIDGRLHAWEWVVDRGRLLKTDAQDHHAAHDLIGCQPMEWDVAGAIIEFTLSASERDVLLRELGADRRVLAWVLPVYVAFQMGVWSMASAASAQPGRAAAAAQVARYRAWLKHLTATLPRQRPGPVR